MKRTLLTCVVLALAATLAVACGASSSPATVTPAPAQTTPHATASVPAGPTRSATATTPPRTATPALTATPIPVSPAPTQRTITDADDRQTVVVPVGTVLVLALDTGFDWSDITVSDPTVLQPYTLAVPPSGSQAAYIAARPGEVTLSATGTVHCEPGVPCPQIARLFRTTIRVTP